VQGYVTGFCISFAIVSAGAFSAEYFENFLQESCEFCRGNFCRDFFCRKLVNSAWKCAENCRFFSAEGFPSGIFLSRTLQIFI